MSNTDAVKQLRGPKYENWPVCDPRALILGGHSEPLTREQHYDNKFVLFLPPLLHLHQPLLLLQRDRGLGVGVGLEPSHVRLAVQSTAPP
jgi:hypothetical protein